MSEYIFSRTELLIGADGLKKLKNSNIWLFGAGGVGSYCAEALIRAGVGSLTVVDGDIVNITNINRQIIAIQKTIGMPKVDVLCERAKDINPDINFTAVHKFYLPDNSEEFDFSDADYVIDAIDTVSAKLDIIERCNKLNIKVISSMGTGNKVDNTKFEICDIYKTHTDPLAKVMRRELKARGVNSLNVVYSTAKPRKIAAVNNDRPPVASISYVPSVGGLIIAGKVIEDILSLKD